MKVISSLKSKDENNRPSFALVLEEYEKGNEEIAKALILEMSKGNISSGEIEYNTKLVVGLNFESGLPYIRFRNYRQEVEATVAMRYDDGKFVDEIKHYFFGDVFGGTAIGWYTTDYLYIGSVKDDTFEGRGTLYRYKYLLKKTSSGSTVHYGNAYLKYYEGEFKQGRFDGPGIIYWDNFPEFFQGKEVDIPTDGIVRERQKLYNTSFKDGNIHGTYVRYYDDGRLNDRGTVYNGIVNSSIWGYSSYLDSYLDVTIPSNIILVE